MEGIREMHLMHKNIKYDSAPTDTSPHSFPLESAIAQLPLAAGAPSGALAACCAFPHPCPQSGPDVQREASTAS